MANKSAMRLMVQLASVLIALSLTGSPARSAPSRDGKIVERILKAIDAVEKDLDPMKSIDRGEEMTDLVRSHPFAASDPEIVRRLTNLLAVPSDGTRGWAAASLGFIGPKAAAAIPALEKAYEERKNMNGNLRSVDAIELALKRIRTPVRRKSTHLHPSGRAGQPRIVADDACASPLNAQSLDGRRRTRGPADKSKTSSPRNRR